MRARFLGIAVLLGSCTAAQPSGAPGRSELAGRVAGAPQRCVPIERDLSLRVDPANRQTLLYGHGKRVWANHLPEGCGFNSGDVLVIKPIGSDYCRGDFVRSFDPVSRFPGPSCILSDFVPYTRAG
jgi:hypothetical protein